MMMMTVMRRIMTWIIVNESRKRSNKIENVWKKKINLLSLSLYKSQEGGRKPRICRPIAFL